MSHDWELPSEVSYDATSLISPKIVRPLESPFVCPESHLLCNVDRFLDLVPPQEVLYAEIEELENKLHRLNSPRRFCHMDINPTNIIYNQEQGSVIYKISLILDDHDYFFHFFTQRNYTVYFVAVVGQRHWSATFALQSHVFLFLLSTLLQVFFHFSLHCFCSFHFF
jgi:hypothetical protein